MVGVEKTKGVVPATGFLCVCSNASSKRLKAEEIVKNCNNDLNDYSRAMILMHDANTKDTTVEALPQIIEKILEQENTVILPITEYTEPIHHKTKE